MTNKNNTLELKILPKVVLRAPRPNDGSMRPVNTRIAIHIAKLEAFCAYVEVFLPSPHTTAQVRRVKHFGVCSSLMWIFFRENCQNVITKLNCQFMDLTDKGLFLIYIKNREVCQNIITKWTCQFMDLTDKAMIVVFTKLNCQFMDLTDKGLFLIYIKNPVKLCQLSLISSPSKKGVFLTVTKIILI